MTSIFHTDFLVIINNMLYANTLTCDNIISEEITIKYNEMPYFGFILQKDNVKLKTKEKIFLRTEYVEKLPIKVTEQEKFSHKSVAYQFVKGADSVKIPTEKRLEFHNLVDTFADYAHSEPKHWTLFKIIALTGYFERLNIRIVSEASFGKDGIVDIIQLLNGGVANLYKATLGKLKYSLKNDFIVINELGALKKEDASDMQTYLLQAGSYKPRYENNSRSVAGTKETMDLTTKTHMIFHNTIDYYKNKNQPFFEEMFTIAVRDRFPALLMKGYVTEDFSYTPIKKDIIEKDVEMIKDIIATINYYREHPLIDYAYNIEDNYFEFKGKEKQRTARTFKLIVKYLAAYSKDEKEFKEWIALLKECYYSYKEMLINSKRVQYREGQFV